MTKMKLKTMLAVASVGAMSLAVASCGNKSTTSDKTETKTEAKDDARSSTKCAVIDKSNDTTLQAMIKEVAPQFERLEYTDAKTGKKMAYNLYTPKDMDKSKKYPLVMFMADASSSGDDVTKPLTQGYGALVWATKESQAKNPCFVLVPQFSSAAVKDSAYSTTPEADMAISLLNSVVADKNVDTNRLYATGQAAGGMLAMYYNVAYPDLFAASIFVDSYWNPDTYDQLVKHKFVDFIAGRDSKAYKSMAQLDSAARKVGVQFTYAEWSAKLPETRQSELASTMLEKGAPVNIFEFEPKSVLPASGEGCEQIYSFDYAYSIQAVRNWLFAQAK